MSDARDEAARRYNWSRYGMREALIARDAFVAGAEWRAANPDCCDACQIEGAP